MEDSYIRCLEEYFEASPGRLRPLMVSLNGHNSWLLSIPRPWADQKQSGRAFFHIVLDPWLVGPTELLGSWFIHVDLPSAPAMSTVAAVEAAARQIEDAASKHVLSRHMFNEVFNPASHVDAILLGFHYYDYVHEATLRDFSATVPVIATHRAASIVKPWNHFRTMAVMPDLEPTAKSWRGPELHLDSILPSWLTVLRLPGHREMNSCTAIVWTHGSDNGNGSEVHEAIFNSPNGTLLDQGPLRAFLDAEPPTRRLAMLHGLKESRIGGKQTSFGARAGLQLYRMLGGVDYWILSNHLTLTYSGMFMRLSRTADTARSLEWALDQELSSEKLVQESPQVFRVPNGGCMVLDV